MAQKILQKRSLTAGKVPDTGSLLVGELGINVADGKVYIHKSGSCLLYTSPSPRDRQKSRMPSSA